MWSSYHRWLLIIILLLAGFAIFLVSNSILNPTARAFSSGPPPGYGRAPGEEPEACAECHLSPGDPGSGQISITVPPTYVPGQTYQVTVTHTNPIHRGCGGDSNSPRSILPTRKPESCRTSSVFTQMITGGPGGNRQYIEHAVRAGLSSDNRVALPGHSIGRRHATDIGVVTFYAAGNHANNDENTSGDYIYFTFAISHNRRPQHQIFGERFAIVANCGSRQRYDYNVTVTPAQWITGMFL